jgi:two-component system CitB family sensor kinase
VGAADGGGAEFTVVLPEALTEPELERAVPDEALRPAAVTEEETR